MTSIKEKWKIDHALKFSSGCGKFKNGLSSSSEGSTKATSAKAFFSYTSKMGDTVEGSCFAKKNKTQ